MRRPLTFTAVAAMTLFLSISPNAHAQSHAQRSSDGLRWDLLDADERRIVDQLAAEFYEETLRQAQSDAIEDQTAELYRGATEEERWAFRKARLAAYKSMSERQREALRGVKRPSYRNLTEAQKAPFRRHAVDQLGAADAIDQSALSQAIRDEI